jgi:Ca2+-binding RTX toxin-like protein
MPLLGPSRGDGALSRPPTRGDAHMAIYDGTPGDDVFLGTGADDTMDGGDGHDYLRARGGNDVLTGGNGDDYLDGGFGDDLIDGGAGLDRAAFYHDATGGVHVDLDIQGVAQDTGQGFDTLIGIEHVSGTTFADTLIGNSGDNWIWGEGGNDNLSGNDGNDLVQTTSGNATMSGGSGVDTASFDDNGTGLGVGGVAVSLLLQGMAQDSRIGSMTLTGFENLSGSSYDDALTGDGGANIIAGYLGNDSLAGGGGDDVLLGDGAITVDTHGVGTSGPIVTYNDVTAILGGAGGDDVLDGGPGNDVLNGGDGSDTASYASASGAVTVFLNSNFSSGAAGSDSFVSIENVTGSAFDDVIRGTNAANLLDGGAGHDFLRGLGGNDLLIGGLGDDYLDGGLGDDLLDGGAGWDRVSFAVSATGGVVVDLRIAGPQATGQGTDTLVGIEHLTGTPFNDTLTGTDGDNWLWGGSDGLGADGNDSISALGGNDLVEVGHGTHLLSGGAGTDTLSVSGNDTDVTGGLSVSLALQGAPQDTGQGLMNLSGFENLSGSKYADTLAGNGGANLLAGDVGNDLLTGGDGDDVLYGDGRVTVDTHDTGGSGPIVTYADVTIVDPTLVAGNDTLVGGKGNDLLNGGGGDDILTGGQGEDVFAFGPASGHDHVTDFAKKDTIAILGVAGVDDFSDLTIANAGGSAVISWGTGDSITLDGYKANKLSAADFSFGPAPAAAPAFAAAGFDGPDAGWHSAAHAAAWTP